MHHTKLKAAMRWRNVDWSLTNYVIAERLGVARSTVKKARKRLGAPPVRPSANWNGVDWTKSNSFIAFSVGVSKTAVAQKRRKLGISKACRPPDPRTEKIDWARVDWSLSNAAIGRALRVDDKTVANWRSKLKAPALSHNKRRRNIVLQLVDFRRPASELASQYGVSAATIYNWRKRNENKLASESRQV